MNSIFITLIPKDKSKQAFDYCPISSVTSVYKIIAMVLSLRISKILEDIISPNQSVLIRDRQIFDAHLVAKEVVNFTRK